MTAPRTPLLTTLRISMDADVLAFARPEPPMSNVELTGASAPKEATAGVMPALAAAFSASASPAVYDLVTGVWRTVLASLPMIEHRSEAGAVAATELGALDPGARGIVMELRSKGEVCGRWRFTARDLGVPVDPEVLMQLQHWPSGPIPLLRTYVAELAQALAERYPTVVKHSLLEQARQLAATLPVLPLLVAESLPLVVRDALPRALDVVDKERRVVWLELAEPLGYLPWLAWEPVLRKAVGVPIVRRSRQRVDALAPKGALDVLVVCSTGSDSVTIQPKAVVGLAREIFAALPAPGRCILHLFADIVHRDVLLQAIKSSGLPVSEDSEPRGQRGVIVHRFPEASKTDAIAKGNWTSWFMSALQGRGIDVLHVMSAAAFPGMHPTLEMFDVPWQQPELTKEYLFLTTARVRIHHVRAARVASVASQLGAWAVVLSAINAGTQRAQLALMHELSGLSPGVFAVHALADDAEAKTCKSLYEFLARPGAARGIEPAVPDSPHLSVQCHPSRLEHDAAVADIQHTFGGEFVDAARRVQAVMERRQSTPAWVSVMQRQIEQSASAVLASTPVTERDKAVQKGMAAALTAAMQIIADNSDPND